MAAASGGSSRNRFSLLEDANQFPQVGGTKKKRKTVQYEIFGNSLSKELFNMQLNGPRFMVLQRDEENGKKETMAKVSPFTINKVLQNFAGKLKSIKRQRDGNILIQTFSKSQACKLTQLKEIDIYKIKITEHPRLNSSRGVVKCDDFLNIPREDLLFELKDQNVIDIKAIQKRNGSSREDTGTYILTFNFPQIPEFIDAGFLRIKVRTFIPNPARCFKCQHFGHITLNCNGVQICANCSQPTHLSDKCLNKSECSNCQGDHPSWSRKCPIFIQESEIQKIKITNNTSMRIARNIYKDKINHTSYSNAVQNENQIKKCNCICRCKEINNESKIYENNKVQTQNTNILTKVTETVNELNSISQINLKKNEQLLSISGISNINSPLDESNDINEKAMTSETTNNLNYPTNTSLNDNITKIQEAIIILNERENLASRNPKSEQRDLLISKIRDLRHQKENRLRELTKLNKNVTNTNSKINEINDIEMINDSQTHLQNKAFDEFQINSGEIRMTDDET